MGVLLEMRLDRARIFGILPKMTGSFKNVFLSEKTPKMNLRGRTLVIICDVKLKNRSPFRKFLKNKTVFYVQAGEKLKTLDQLKVVVDKLDTQCGSIPRKQLVLMGLGGGSVSDFTGFLASIYKRGVELWHMPTTWLAALDSVHGGKTALNCSSGKNQLGTFYLARSVFIVKSFLFTQSRGQLMDSWGEVVKMALLEKSLIKKISKPDAHHLWNVLPEIIEAKMKIVEKDPREENGIRKFLNLGHTFGHAFEISMKWGHGTSVGQGLIWETRLSHELGILNRKNTNFVLDFLKNCNINKMPLWMSEKNLKALLLRDKKNSKKNKIQFILLNNNLKPVPIDISTSKILALCKSWEWTSKAGFTK
jgi:3-dehydroquinate synthetase